uniref:Uncharacterized protein AlNc14C308G10462 n=1 Tax=Albugo laibachii Nc14 TaxID=890382 RepID=F0WW12_9STRA|nr:conserved hypothetical protein [Albugo laibachii Nc14]|eukprot:CCA25615.1 conserved hypothetical protein [Albugo laibachii Nc14]
MSVAAQNVPLKVVFKGEVHRIRICLEAFTLDELHNTFMRTFKLTPGSYIVRYKDSEGDCVNVVTDAEFEEARQLHTTGWNKNAKVLRFTAIMRHQAVFQETVAEPILKAIDKLMETLNIAMDKVKSEEWAQKAHTGVSHTRVAVKQVADGARESIIMARQNMQDISFEQVLKETADGLSSVAESISSYAQDIVGKTARAAEPEASEKPDEVGSDKISVEKQESNDESDWEKVAEIPAEAAAERALGAEDVDVQSDKVATTAANEVEEKQWANEVAVVQSVLPSIEDARAYELLEQLKGDVQQVVNALMGEI